MRLTLSKLPGHINRIVDKVAPQAVEVPVSAEASVAEGSAAQPTPARQASSPQLQPAGPQSPQAAVANGGTAGPYGSLSDKECQRLSKFDRILSADVVDLTALRDASWSGIPTQHRMTAWQQLLGYLPANREWREASLQRKRREYSESVPRYFDVDDSERSEYQRALFHQILIDVPRTCSSSALFQHPTVQRCLERILYIWALRHPASGYVQGINDLVLPFFVVFLHNSVEPSLLVREGGAVEVDIDAVPADVLAHVEADSYWCLSKLLDVIQDHYTFAQPGIQRMVFRLKEIVQRIDRPLHAHLASQGIQFIQFAFRWMNCLLMRELALPMITRMWDTYLAESAADIDSLLKTAEEGAAPPPGGDSFAVLHVYVCAALLLKWSDKLQQMQFQELVMFLQHLPTSNWQATELEELLSQAYLYKQLYHNSQAHLQSQAD